LKYFKETRLSFRLRLRRKKKPEIHFSHIKIRQIPGIFLNLSLNLNLAILKMRIAGRHESIANFLESGGDGSDKIRWKNFW
jgi:hypothetical protein